jgi:hypothetical protein
MTPFNGTDDCFTPCFFVMSSRQGLPTDTWRLMNVRGKFYGHATTTEIVVPDTGYIRGGMPARLRNSTDHLTIDHFNHHFLD